MFILIAALNFFLGKQMSEQKSMLEAKSLQLVQVQQDVHLKNDTTQLLKQANMNIVRF